jgi:hypothetical protein
VKIEIRGVTISDVTDAELADLRWQLGVTETFDIGAMLDTAGAARRLGTSTEYVRDNAKALGGVKLTAGPKARWKFDPAKLGVGTTETAPPTPLERQRRRPPGAATGSTGRLKVRG